MNDRDLAKTVEALQEAVATLEKRTDDLALKARLVTNLGVSKDLFDPLFGERGFWENIVDVGLSECSDRCIEELTRTRKAIAENTAYSDAERQQAYEEAMARAVACHKACAERFPIG